MNAHTRGLAPPAAQVQTSGAVPVHLGEGGTALTRIAPACRLLREDSGAGSNFCRGSRPESSMHPDVDG